MVMVSGILNSPPPGFDTVMVPFIILGISGPIMLIRLGISGPIMLIRLGIDGPIMLIRLGGTGPSILIVDGIEIPSKDIFGITIVEGKLIVGTEKAEQLMSI